MKLEKIDAGAAFDFGRVSAGYADYRDIYPQTLYQTLYTLGIGREGQKILDLGSGTGVLPRHLYAGGAAFAVTDVSENQIKEAQRLARQAKMEKMEFCVCGAEETGFADSSFDAVTAAQCFHYFNAGKAAAEIARVLKPGGLFCKIFMEWLPHEDEKIAEMEKMVLRYNPAWTGGGYAGFRYEMPAWSQKAFRFEALRVWRERLVFTKEAWLGRILTCRGVGASLSPEKTKKFEEEYRAALHKYPGETLELAHEVQVEVYRKA